MGRTLALLVVTLLAIPAHAQAGRVNVIELDNQIISPVTQKYIFDAIARSEEERAAALVIVLDTPGGLLESTRAIVKRMMNAEVPIVVYVAPSGARAGSAGVFITMAAHVAAMAPSTNIGAAHPVSIGEGGGPVKKLIRRVKRAAKPDLDRKRKDDVEEEIIEESEEEAANPMSDKVVNDTVAWITTIAKRRGRNEEWAKKAVTDSFSVTEDEALKERIIDLIARDVDDLLTQIDGRSIELPEGQVALATKDADVARIEMTPREQFLAVITNPNIAYILMLLGTMGLIAEFSTPGFGFAGIAGFICLVLALFAFQALPINYAGVTLIVVGFLLLVAEVKVAGLGFLAVGGVIALTLGSLMLIDGPGGLTVSLSVILPVVLGVAAVVLFLVGLALRIHRQPTKTGPQGLIGERGVAQTDLEPSGQVFVHGEIWTAVAPESVRKGEPVEVTAVDGLTLRVKRRSR